MPGAGEMGSKAYRARLARGSGVTSYRPFESDFGKKILLKYGWKEGEGLGRKGNGRTDCIQAVRRDVNVGLGHEKRKADDQWDNWWADCFNNIAKKVKVSSTQATPAKDDSDSSSDESSNKNGGRITAVKKASVMGGKLRRVLRQEATAK
jgi:hypothetical protein